MFANALLQEQGNGKLRSEEQLLATEFERRGIPVTLFTEKRVWRRQLPVTRQTFVAGDLDVMEGVMKILGIEVPKPNNYPRALEPFLHRRVWRSTLAIVERAIYSDGTDPLFAKPATRAKNFTGRVFSCAEDFREIGNVSRRQEVWCSDVVSWVSEFRVYVVGDEIRSIDRYHGDSTVTVDHQVIESALKAYRASGEAPAAYAIDFGVLESGQTALIEANDGYSVGRYQIAASDYTDVVCVRWRELLDSLDRTPAGESSTTGYKL